MTGSDPTELYECVEAGKQTSGAFTEASALILATRAVSACLFLLPHLFKRFAVFEDGVNLSNYDLHQCAY